MEEPVPALHFFSLLTGVAVGGEGLVSWSWGKIFNVAAGSSERFGKSATLLILLTRLSRSGVQAPLGLQWLVDLLGRAELEVADLLRDGGALSNWVKLGDKLGLEATGLLRVQVTSLLRNINQGGDDLLVALFFAFFSDTSSTTDFNWKLLALSITHKLSCLLLNVLGGTRGFVDSAALLGALAIANLFNGPVAFLHSLVESLLLEGDLTSLFKILLANLLLSWRELCDVGVVALLDILVGAFQDGVFLESLHGLLLLNTAKAGFSVILAAAEINPT